MIEFQSLLSFLVIWEVLLLYLLSVSSDSASNSSCSLPHPTLISLSCHHHQDKFHSPSHILSLKHKLSVTNVLWKYSSVRLKHSFVFLPTSHSTAPSTSIMDMIEWKILIIILETKRNILEHSLFVSNNCNKVRGTLNYRIFICYNLKKWSEITKKECKVGQDLWVTGCDNVTVTYLKGKKEVNK